MDSVILATPIVLIGFIIAFALMFMSFVKRIHAIVLAISMLIFIASACYAALLGATLGEIGTVSIVFFLASVFFYAPRRNGK